jgi:hypothetical protein
MARSKGHTNSTILWGEIVKTFLQTNGVTTDGATTEFARYTMLENSAIEVKATAVAVGSNDASARFERSALIKRLGSGNAQVVNSSAPLILNEAGSLTWSLVPSVSGADVILSGVGAAGVRVDWDVSLVGHEAIRS